MIEEIKNNLATEMEMAREMGRFIEKLDGDVPEQEMGAGREEKAILENVIKSLSDRIKILNSSVGTMIRHFSLAKSIGEEKSKVSKVIEKVIFKKTGLSIILHRKDRDRFLEELSISEGLLKKLGRKALIPKEKERVYKKANLYGRIANRFFLQTAARLLKKEAFKKLNMDIKKSNLDILGATYISMMLLGTVIAAIAGIFLFSFILIFNIGIEYPFLRAYGGDFLSRFIRVIWVIPSLPILAFLAFYFYPSVEQSSLAKKIDSELPFVVIHMGSISGSGIEPTQIFKIVGLSKEYKSTRVEIRKLLNQINVYGYDLVTALQNVASITPSAKLSELFNGLATTISSGGELKTFFEKRAETLLLNYRLEREKFTKVAETFMDIYISVVIAAPMIFLLLLIMIAVSGIGIGLGVGQLTLLIISSVVLMNVLFLWVLSLKQPSY